MPKVLIDIPEDDLNYIKKNKERTKVSVQSFVVRAITNEIKELEGIKRFMAERQDSINKLKGKEL